jgi:hypothetical protein
LNDGKDVNLVLEDDQAGPMVSDNAWHSFATSQRQLVILTAMEGEPQR